MEVVAELSRLSVPFRPASGRTPASGARRHERSILVASIHFGVGDDPVVQHRAAVADAEHSVAAQLAARLQLGRTNGTKVGTLTATDLALRARVHRID